MTEREPFYLTPSRITEALSCGLRYHRNYVQKLPHGKDGLSRFQGDRQHVTLQRWSQGEGELLPLWERAWEEGLAELAAGFLPMFADFVVLRAEEQALREQLESVVQEILAARPDVKQPRATKEYKEAAKAAGAADLEKRRDKLVSREQAWFRSDSSPWRVTGPGPFVVYVEGGDALVHFGEWWTGHSDGCPEILHVEVKDRILIGDGAYKVTGVIDAVYLWPDGRTEVVDYKRARGGDGALQHFVQASVYALTCEQVLGFVPDLVTFHYLKDGERISYEVRPEWTGRLLDLCARVERMHSANDFAPSFRTCSWCDYAELCEQYFDFKPIVDVAEAA